MAIKARPYGGKPGIAVAKETKPRLLTVWPLKLRGAVTPVARTRRKKIKSEENRGERRGKKQSVSFMFLRSVKSSHCPISGSERLVDVTVLLIHRGRGFDFAPTRRLSTQTAKKALLSINCLH